MTWIMALSITGGIFAEISVQPQFGKKVDPVKSMFYSLPMCIVFLITGLVFLYT